jgi:FxsC-like protein
MPYQCFFSYARDNRNSDLDRFVADLRENVLLRKDFPQDEVVFFDGEGIEAGAPWKQELSKALQTSRVFLAICSPRYINSDYCGKEFQVFLERYRSYVDQNKPATAPKLIIPVLWGAPAGSLREVISEFQYTDDDFPAVYAREGLRYMMALKEHADDYTKFVTRLAEKIVDGSAAHPLPDLPQLRVLDQVNSAFHDAAQAEAEAGNRAWFVFVAAKPNELSPPRISIDRYKKAGGRDWRPFHPDVKESVGLLAQSAAAQYYRYFTELPMGNALLSSLDQAEEKGEPVLVLVDPWTLRLSEYRAKMKGLDRHIARTCGVVVPWNSPDPETDAERDVLKDLLVQTFALRTKFGRELHYWGEVASATELNTRLLEMLAHYTNRVIENTKATRTIPEEMVLTPENDPGVPLGHPPLVDNGPIGAND